MTYNKNSTQNYAETHPPYVGPTEMAWQNNTNARMFSMMKISFKQQVLALATLPLIIAILAITILVTAQSRDLAQRGITTFEQNMLEAKQQELISYTNLALSSIDEIYSTAGPNDEEAQQRVKEILNSLSYSEDGYFFVYDFAGVNLVHPRQPFRIGKNWIDLTDPDGDLVIENLIDVARSGGGFHYYKWEKPSSLEIADKLSYAIALDKWGWMMGTGVYIDDVVAQSAAANSTLKSSIDSTFIVIAMITLLAVIAVFFTGLLLNLRERRMADHKLKELTQRIIDTQEEERARIARELHDGISQHLVGVRYLLDLAQRRVKNGTEDAYATIERGTKGLNGAIREVRRISHDLRPGILDDLGLRSALIALTENFSERTGITVKLNSVSFKNLLPADAKTALYRVAQEALSNIERHSSANKVTIDLTSKPSGLRLTIADNGKGFQNHALQGQGFKKEAKHRYRDFSSARNASTTSNLTTGLGLRNMEERMSHFSGTLNVQSSYKGTILTARLPRSILRSVPEKRVTA